MIIMIIMLQPAKEGARIVLRMEGDRPPNQREVVEAVGEIRNLGQQE